ncbi:hypothetical protein [Pseudoxanthomonas sp.]|uniref:hypothetical protein n=1 Tax=Pseudoxanthomonas sp. TaxID=1871049 RepID=UPI00261D4597|nr:hypothetical protein [Pseudoxanthomonas sp.]WDS36258.1 MAG: hypothetical protein O8I58_18635 [Pseudoxanthomonas sp.]
MPRDTPRRPTADRNDRDDRRNEQLQRLSRDQQERRIRDERQRADQYRRSQDERRRLAEQRTRDLERQRRHAQYRYQQDYYRRFYAQQARWQARGYDYNRDPYYSTPASYRYGWGGVFYETNRYGADLLRQAVNYGYNEGFEAGRADRQDGWGFSYDTPYAYQDANYGYYGYYVSQGTYNHYFREGFRRGYEDGYYNRYRYGTRESNGSYVMLGAVLGTILGLTLLNN